MKAFLVEMDRFNQLREDLRLANERNALLVAALEAIGWMDEFLDEDGAKAMLKIARDAVNANQQSTEKS